MKKYILFYCIYSALLIGITYFIYRNYKISQDNLRALHVVKIDKSNLQFPERPSLQYYYELKPKTDIFETRRWDKTNINYSINQDGLNERYDYSINKDVHTLRILTLGDSFTFGQYVETTNNWPEQLENLLNKNKLCTNYKKYEVINLGMRGYDVPYIVQRYIDKGSKYQPDVIFWFESGSGFSRFNELMHPYVQSCEEKVATQSEHLSVNMDFYPCWTAAENRISNEYTNEQINIYLRTWMNKFFSETKNVSLIFGLFSNIRNDNLAEMNIRISNYSNATIFTSIPDIYPINGAFPDDHPNEKGHRMIAQSVYDYFLQNKKNILRCDESP